MHKSAAVQAALIDNPRKAKEVGVAVRLKRLYGHDCLSYLTKLGEDCPALDAVNKEAAFMLEVLGAAKSEACYRDLVVCVRSPEAAYDRVQGLSDADLDRLFAVLSAIEFGQEDCGELDTREGSFFYRVARDLGVDMRGSWIPGEWFLSRRSMKQLGAIIRETGLNRLYGSGMGFKKGELVRSLTQYFRKVRGFRNPADDQKRAREWLPEAMKFPAIDPDACKPQEETEAADEHRAEAA